jgi:hypothetical protein
MDDDQTVEFDGKLVEPIKGYYKCPYSCHNKQYPKPKWKTKKGFINHIKKCKCSKDVIEEKRLIAEIKKRIQDGTGEIALLNCPLTIGDSVWYVNRSVVKPMYAWKFGRQVKVRYEEILEYSARHMMIEDIRWDGQQIVINNGIPISWVKGGSRKVAENSASEAQRNHDHHIALSERCR